MKKKLLKTKKTDKKIPKRVFDSDDSPKSELDTASALEAVAVSEGGLIIQASLVKEIVSLVSTLTIKYSTMTHIEFIALSADMKTKVDMLHTLSRAERNKDFLVENMKEELEK